MQTRRAFLVSSSAAALTACAPRASITLVPEAALGATRREIFVGTTRAANEAGAYGNTRAFGTAFSRYAVSIPPEHVTGRIELAGRRGADPNKHFVATEEEIFPSSREFRSSIARALRAQRRGQREVVVYVHGFNNTFADGLYRIAQIGHDLKVPALTVHYSWPSAAKALNYAYDRDSVLFARDGLVQLLKEVRAAGAENVTLVGHSMGTLLSMEVMRQLEIEERGQVNKLVHAVILFSPDIDVELFRTQALRIGKLPEPFVIFTSRRDRALALSARLTGQRQRLGNLRDYSYVQDLDVVILDVSEFNAGPDGHFALARSPALQSIFGNVGAVNAALGADNAGRVGLFPGTVLTLQNATAIILSPVAAIGQ